MSTGAQITEQTANPPSEQRRYVGPKPSAETRISELLRKNRDLEAKLATALNRLATFETAEAARKQEEQANWNQFLAQCEAVRKSSPEFDQALRRIADIPPSWLREITRMSNPTGFVLYLGGATQFLEYLRELKPEAAIKRIRQCGYDIHSKLPKFQETK